jgi:hypothetical protein
VVPAAVEEWVPSQFRQCVSIGTALVNHGGVLQAAFAGVPSQNACSMRCTVSVLISALYRVPTGGIATCHGGWRWK